MVRILVVLLRDARPVITRRYARSRIELCFAAKAQLLPLVFFVPFELNPEGLGSFKAQGRSRTGAACTAGDSIGPGSVIHGA